MPKRFFDTETYSKAWFRKLSPKMKCAWFFLTSKCDLAGVWSVDMESLCFHVGEEITLEQFLAEINKEKERLQLLDGDKKIFITDFIEFQNGEISNHSPVHKAIIKLLEKHGIERKTKTGPSDTPSAVLYRLSEKKKREIMVEDRFECSYCGSTEEVMVDHIVPRSMGGDNRDENLTTACRLCNSKKSGGSVYDFIESNNLHQTLSPLLVFKIEYLESLNTLIKPLNSPLVKVREEVRVKVKEILKVKGMERKKGREPETESVLDTETEQEAAICFEKFRKGNT